MAVKNKAQKYRWYPTKEQADNLARTFGCVRLVYNLSKQTRDEAYQKGKPLNTQAMMRELTQIKKQPEYSFLKDVASVPLQQAVRHHGIALERAWQGVSKFPRFKKKGKSRDSAIYTSNGFKLEQLEDGTAIIRLGTHQESMNIIWDRPLPIGVNVTKLVVSRDAYYRYFVSICFETEIQPLPKAKNEAIGLDLGLTHFIVDSEGNKTKHPKPGKKYAKQLARRQRAAAKKQVGSKNRLKANKKVNKIHKKIVDVRRDFAHKQTTRLVRENQTICVETLMVKNMMKNKKLARTIQDVGWAMFLNMLEYKADWYGRVFIKISQWEPTTQRCSECKVLNKELTLKDRYWDCPSCGTHHDRDLNAAINIRTAGLAGIVCGTDIKLKPTKPSTKSTKSGSGNCCETGLSDKTSLVMKQKTLKSDLKSPSP